MRANIQKVFEAWEQGTPATGDSKRTCYTDGESIYSYKMRIAYREGDGRCFRATYQSGPSRTTRSQIKALEVLIPYALEFVGSPTIGRRS